MGSEMCIRDREIEGHENTGDSIKTTRYDHLIPLMVNLSMDPQIRGFLFLIHTIGGDVSCGLALAETMASLRQPCVSLVMGDSHSIGVPLAVAVDYSFIVPSATVLPFLLPPRLPVSLSRSRTEFSPSSKLIPTLPVIP